MAEIKPTIKKPSLSKSSTPVDLNSDLEIYRKIVDRMEQGVLVYDGQHVLAANSQLSKLLDCPPELVAPGASLEDYIAFGAARGDYTASIGLTLQSMRMHIAAGKDYVVERSLPNGRTLRIDCRNEGHFGVGTYTDITEAKAREQELKEREAEVRKLAETDGLTGLGNRRSFDAQLSKKFGLLRHANSNNTLALILIDLDRFKSVNDTYGHAMGDELLQEIARRFESLVPKGSVIARIGGDEFATIVEARRPKDVQVIAENLSVAARQPVVAESIHLSVGASMGIAMASSEINSANKMLVAADLALYHAKAHGRGAVKSYQTSLGEEANKRCTIERDLQSVLPKKELELHYQVQRDLQTDTDIGFEALMRWQHPKLGLLSPGEFIQIAEETSAIVEMGQWALLQATKDIAKLDPVSHVAVNVSPVQFMKSNLIYDVEKALSESGLEAERLEIEVTEDLLLEDTDQTLGLLKKLRDLGVGISLDDFGSGYSSLGYLTRFPFTKLKIDRNFVDGMTKDRASQVLINSILVLAASLDLRVTAEGVERDEQLEMLKLSNCDEAQGFLLGMPLPFDALRD